uniref:C-C motif chemokine n=1 Tax=Oryzias latipes TaxID=8090 RepID=A0A3P9JQG7_ORYLA
MMMMKASVALVTFFLLLSPVTILASQNSYQPDVCCFKFFPKRLHANVVESIKHTSTHCAKKAVLLTLKNKQEYCADPSMEWVKKLIKNFL